MALLVIIIFCFPATEQMFSSAQAITSQRCTLRWPGVLRHWNC